jgi:mRNA-degrading endonuclease YafQ of YafQ-DinJ toxin-antitoxin module
MMAQFGYWRALSSLFLQVKRLHDQYWWGFLLIYELQADGAIIFIRTGTHAELF